MRVLIDTNILARLTQPDHPLHECAWHSVKKLRRDNHELRIVPQVLYEYWAVATRAAVDNGLGLTTDETRNRLNGFKAFFAPLRDERGILERWESLVVSHAVRGKRTHDARLVAAMQRHGLTHPLTFNIADFQRYSGIDLLDPRAITQF